MAHGQDSEEKIIYVGDSRVRQNRKAMLPKDFSAYPGKSEVFIPNFLLKEWMVAVVLLTGILALVMADPTTLGYPADPTNTTFIPMPDWYFLFLYQALKYPYTSEHFVLFGTLVLPGLGILALLLTPFLDNGKERRFYRRPVASSMMILALFAMSYLTWVSWHHYQAELKAANTTPEDVQREIQIHEHKIDPGVSPDTSAAQAQPAPLVATSDPGYALIKKATCIQCHGPDLTGNKAIGAPSLHGIGDTLSQEQILNVIKNGFGKMPAQYDANIQQQKLTDQQITQIAAWLAKQKTQSS